MAKPRRSGPPDVGIIGARRLVRPDLPAIVIAFVATFIPACTHASGLHADLAMPERTDTNTALVLSLAGDVMTGRGVDQALPVSVDPVLYEAYVKDARGYLQLAERESGEIPTPVDYDYVWGDALGAWAREAPEFNLINLETSVTTSDSPWPGKGIHYRMHPDNVEILTAAGVDYCSLANNHVLDWGRTGLDQTLTALEEAGIAFSGAGRNAEQAMEPAVLKTSSGRLLVFSWGAPSSGIPDDWAAEEQRSGVTFLEGLGDDDVRNIRAAIDRHRKPGDLVVLSVHWGGNWGYGVPSRHREFAHRLVEEAGVDVIHGHSSHHPMGIEVHTGKLILYGAGDLINDYEGIGGRERYRAELSLLYFPSLDPATGKLRSLQMAPFRMHRLRLNRASRDEAQWLTDMLSREGKPLGTEARLDEEGSIHLVW